MDQAGLEFLENRGLDPELAVKLGLDTENGWLVIPHIRGGKTVNRKFRKLDGKEWRQDAGGAKVLWNVDCLEDCRGNDVVVTEGELDGIAFIQAGFPWTVSVPDGAPQESITDPDSVKYDYLDEATLKLLRGARSVILATDNDDQGRALAFDLSLRIGRANCRHAIYPKISPHTELRCKDGNIVLQRYGVEGLRKVVSNAPWWSKPSVRRMSELPPRPDKPCWSTGVEGLAPYMNLRPGDLSVWTGIPSHGKSTFLNHLLCRFVELHGSVVGFASFEQEPTTDHRRLLRAWKTATMAQVDPELDFDYWHLPDEARDRVDRWIDLHFCFVDADQDSEDEYLNLVWMKDAIEAAVKRFGAQVFVIDPWNELEHEWPRHETQTQYIGRAIRDLRRLANKLWIHIAIVAHPTKMKGGEVPTLYDIDGSANWANKPDLGVVVYRTPEGLSEIYIRKVRYDVIGKTGIVPFVFHRETKLFSHDLTLADEYERKLL